jgi:hypothetical protein
MFYWGDREDLRFVNQLQCDLRTTSSEVHFICLNPSLEILKGRVVSEERRRLGKPATSSELLEAMKNWQLSLISDSEVIDNSLLTEYETTELILSRLGIDQ